MYNMNSYPNPTSITMQRPNEEPIQITLEDAVVIMSNQQKTIEDLIRNNQRMFQYIQEMQRNGGGYMGGGIQFSQENIGDPAEHLRRGGAGGFAPSETKPMTLSEYLENKKKKASGEDTTAVKADPNKPISFEEYIAKKKAESSAPAPAAAPAPMTLDEYIAQRKAAAAVPTAAAPASKTTPEVQVNI
jgi:hypothetical protein